ncbi:MAG: DUF2752 domain-containing protein [Deltaproteobacteria bacterium]|nr:DUF2752 domain-containing protein [Deltaproteobacteria bacterium]
MFVTPYELLPPVLCPFRQIFGIPCLTCGGTRAACALSRLELGLAFSMNPLVFLAFCAALMFALRVAWSTLTGRDPRDVDFRSDASRLALRVGVLLATVANWAYLIAVGR